MTVSINKKDVAKKGKAKPDWVKIKNDYIDQNLNTAKNPNGWTLKQAAKEWDVAYITVKKHAAPSWPTNKGKGWQDQVEVSRTKNNKAVNQLMSSVQVFDEFEIRYRHAVTARMAYSKAAKRISLIKPHELTVDQAIKLMTMAMHMEVEAAGLPTTSVEFLGSMERTSDKESRADRIHKHNMQRELGKRFVEWKREELKKQYGDKMEVLDITANAPELPDGS